MSSSAGTVILTGANGCLGRSCVKYLLQAHPDYHIVLALRDDSHDDRGTRKLLSLLKPLGFPSNVTFHRVNFECLASVQEFCDTITARIETKELPPVSAIICNAATWTRNSPSGHELTYDGYELFVQVNYLAHFAIVLQLIPCMSTRDARVVFLSCEAHDPEKIQTDSFGTPTDAPISYFSIPKDIRELANPPHENSKKPAPRGLQRYGLSKLCGVMFVYELNRRLVEDTRLQHITSAAIDPGTLGVPKGWGRVLRHLVRTRRYSDAAKDVVELAVGPDHIGKTGYFTMLRPSKSSEESYETGKQKALWKESLRLTGIEPEETVLRVDWDYGGRYWG